MSIQSDTRKASPNLEDLKTLPLTLTILAPRGGGKTKLARHLIRSEDRLIVLDTAHETDYDDAGLIFSSAQFSDPLVEMLRFLTVNQKKQFRVVYRPPSLSQGKRDADFIFQAALAIGNADPRGVTLVWEEVSRYSRGNRFSEDLENVIVFGRHQGVRMIATSQRPAQVPNLLIAESEMILGRLKEPNDLQYLKRHGNLTKEAVAELSALPGPIVKDSSGRVVNLPPGQKIPSGTVHLHFYNVSAKMRDDIVVSLA